MGWYPCCCPNFDVSGRSGRSGSSPIDFRLPCVPCGFPACFLVNVAGVIAAHGNFPCDCDALNAAYQVEILQGAAEYTDFCVGETPVDTSLWWGLKLDIPGCCYTRALLNIRCILVANVQMLFFEFVLKNCVDTLNVCSVIWFNQVPALTFDCDQLDGYAISGAGGDNGPAACGAPLASTATLHPCGSDNSCCGSDTPHAGTSTCDAVITGLGACVGPTNGTKSMTYFGTAAINPCGGAGGFVAGPKWFSDHGPYMLRTFCLADRIRLDFFYWTCNANGTLGGAIIWEGEAPLGSCNFEGAVLALSADPFGCVDPASTVTLQNFAL